MILLLFSKFKGKVLLLFFNKTVPSSDIFLTNSAPFFAVSSSIVFAPVPEIALEIKSTPKTPKQTILPAKIKPLKTHKPENNIFLFVLFFI